MHSCEPASPLATENYLALHHRLLENLVVGGHAAVRLCDDDSQPPSDTLMARATLSDHRAVERPWSDLTLDKVGAT